MVGHGCLFMKAASNVVRWILVVTLGCSLGLLLVFITLNLRPVRRYRAGNIYAVHRVPVHEPGFRLTDEELEKDLTDVIQAQLAAFRNDDYPKAYHYAASGLKAQLPLPAFERMVKHLYPVIAQSRSAQFGVSLDNGEQAVVNVGILGESGHFRHYRYLLQLENSGWKIYGVTEVKSTSITI